MSIPNIGTKHVLTGGPCTCCGQPEGSMCSCLATLQQLEKLETQVTYYKKAWERCEKENDELKETIKKLEPAAILQAIREGNVSEPIPLSVIGFNHWLAMLPDDDFSEAFERATPVRWDEKTQTWVEGEE